MDARNSEVPQVPETVIKNPQTRALKEWLLKRKDAYVQNFKKQPLLVGSFTAMLGLEAALGAGMTTHNFGVTLLTLAGELAIPVFTVKTQIK